MEGDDLLLQLEQILENDNLLDEIGFIHPTQFESLDPNSGSNPSQFNNKFFWNKDHKLAICTQILSHLYKSSINSHTKARRSFKLYSNSKENYSSGNKDDSGEFTEKDLLRHSKALVILSPDFLTAWNSRKLVLSKEENLKIFMDELQLSNLVLSYSPKSECAWNHRRWVIKYIAEKFQNLAEIICNESQLVKKICAKFKMNYRAWNHGCWLVNYMTKQQVLEELIESRKWAELHISDNSCFHFRTCLLQKILEISEESDVCFLWEDELKWNELLIARYIGREALWVHRRFLSLCWMRQFLTNKNNDLQNGDLKLDLFLDQEVKLAKNCSTAPPDEFEETQVQSQLSISYLLWISKQFPSIECRIRDRLREVTDVTSLLVKICPEKALFWRSI